MESRRIWDGIREARKEPLEDWLGIKHKILLDALQETQGILVTEKCKA